ncbi:hypothetical protein DMENIID0001_129300 [Sergentomyia squamirostris]
MDRAYQSIFKIDGIPILPPLMTDAVKLEMRQYKMQALKLEERLKHVKELKENLDSTIENLSTQEDNGQGYVTCKSFGSFSDIATEIEIPPGDGRDSPLFIPSSKGENSSKTGEELTVEEIFSNRTICQSPEVRSEVVKSASSVPLSISQDIENVPGRVRSNSYTLEAPSPHLVNLLKKSPDITPKVNLKKVKSKVDSRLSSCKPKKNISKAGIKKALSNSSVSSRPSGVGKIKPQRIVRRSESLPVAQKFSEIQKEEPPKKSPEKKLAIPSNQNEISEFLSKIEAEHKMRMQELLERQLEDQKKFRETFEKQQKLLLESLQNSFPETSLPSLPDEDFNGNDTSLSVDLSESTPVSLKHRTNSLERVTQIFSKQHLSQVRQESDPLSPRSTKAASVINAHVRGYLVRRLLRTEAVQQIIQTFHDTYAFIFELHRDARSKNSSNPSDIELHRRLKHQVNSTRGSLHSVFFQIPVKDQMEIIAKDRENLRLRLQRAAERRLNQSADTRKTHLNKLKIVAL